MDTTIRGLQLHFHQLYGRINLINNGSIPQRALNVTTRLGKMMDAVRKNEHQEGRLARTLSFAFGLVNYYYGVIDLETYMMMKFPSFGCRYCQLKPCGCDKATRPTPTDYSINEEQRTWTLRNWQLHLESVYGHSNVGNFLYVLGRALSEFGELSQLHAFGAKTPNNQAEFIREVGLELADLMTWIITLGYVLGIDLEKAISDRYETCPACRLMPCGCPLVLVNEKSGHFTHVISTKDFMDP